MNRPLKIVVGLIGIAVFLAIAIVMLFLTTALKPLNLVGFQAVDIPDPGHESIRAVIWYPTTATAGFVLLGASLERIARNGPVKGDHLPLIVMSHGTGGGPASHADTALALASAGFVVVAPIHTGDNYTDSTAVGTAIWLVDRARHVQRVTDYIMDTWRERSHLNPDQVGIFGFSAGAITALISVGGTPDLRLLQSHCAAQTEFVCTLFPVGDLAHIPFVSDWTHDPRIKAAVIVAPGLGFSFEPMGLLQVSAPVQLWQGDQDQTVPYKSNAGEIRGLLPNPPEFHSVPGAIHYSFLAPCRILGPPSALPRSSRLRSSGIPRRFQPSHRCLLPS